MKQKFKKILSILVIFTIGITAGYVIFNKPEEALETENEPKQVKEKNLLSYYLENDNGEYVASTGESWPTDGYIFNSTLSKCENGGELGWDSTNGVVTMTGNMSDKCYIYFDLDPLIEFYLNDVLFYYEPDMTWDEWLNSSYSDNFEYKGKTLTYDEACAINCVYISKYMIDVKDGYFLFDSTIVSSALTLGLYTSKNYMSNWYFDSQSDTLKFIYRSDLIYNTLKTADLYGASWIPSQYISDCSDLYYYIIPVHNECLTPNTLIDVEEIDEKGKKRRRRKKLKDIKVGDKVICINPITLELDVDTVVECDGNMNKKHTCYDNWYFDDETVITTVHRHRFYNVENSKFMYMEEWNIGDHGINIDNKKIKLIKHEHIEEEINHCTLFTEKYNNYFANGMLSGNRRSKNMKL